MPRKNTPESAEEALRKMPRREILTLASQLCNAAKKHVADGKPTTQEDIAILNRARRQLAQHPPTN